MNLIKKALRGKAKRPINQLEQMLYSHLAGGSPLIFYDYGKADFITEGYSRSSDVYKIVNKIIDKSAVATPYVYIDREGVKSRMNAPVNAMDVARNRLRKKSLDFADGSSDLVQLLNRPNEHQTFREFISLARIFYHIQGEMLIYRETGDDGCALSLNVAPSHLMTPVYGDDYNQIIRGWKLKIGPKSHRDLDAENVMHFKRPNPNYDWKGSQLRGFAPLSAGLKDLQLSDKSREAWLKAMENEGAKGIVSPNHPNPENWLLPEQVKETQTIIDSKIHGTSNRNKIAVSGMPLQYSHIGLSPDALNIINGLKYSMSDLCNLWGVPPELFNEDPTYQNQKEAGKRFVKEVILPYLNAEEDKWNKWLVEPFRVRDNKNYVIDYDLSAFEELRLDNEEVDAMLKTHTINEVRVMQGSDELETSGADEVFVSAGQFPLSDFSNGFGIE